MTDYKTMTNAELARAAVNDWETPWFGAVPYVEAMREMLAAGMDPLTDAYYADSPGEVVLRFLGNAAQWRGPVAREVKAEMKKRMGLK